MKEAEVQLCIYCKVEFTPLKKWQKFCCDKHRNAWHNAQKLDKLEALLAELDALREGGVK